MKSDHKDIRDWQVQNHFTSMKKTNSHKYRIDIANALGKMYEKNDEYSDGIFTRIYKFISDSSDKEEKKIGLIVLSVLGLKMQGSARSAYVNKFHSPVFKLFENNSDQTLIQFIRQAYNIILQIGGNQNDAVVQSDLNNSLLLLKGNIKDVKKIGAYSAIQVLINTSPYLTFKKLVQKSNDENIDNLSILIATAQSKNIRVRQAYLNFLSDYIQYASQKKDLSFQQHTISRIVGDSFPKQTNQEQIHLFIQGLKICLKYLRAVFSPQRLEQCTLYVLQKITINKNLTIQRSLINLIPEIVTQNFQKSMLPEIMLYLRSIKQRDQIIAQISINKILNKFKHSFAQLSENILKPLLSDITKSLRNLSSKPLSKFTISSDTANNQFIFQEQQLISEKVQSLSIILINDTCQQTKPVSSNRITNLHHNRHKKSSRAYQKDKTQKILAQIILTSTQLNQLASSAMLLSLNKKTLRFINQISKRNTHNLGVILERKLIILLYKILTGFNPKALSYRQDSYSEQLRIFQQRVQKIIITESDEIKVRAIESLSIFKFRQGLRDYVGGFIKQKVLKKYLEWGNGLMRCASVEAAFNLYTKKNNTIAQNQMMEILDKLIRLGMTDQQQCVRAKVFTQLYTNIEKVQNFYNFVMHPNLLIHLFQATQDPNQYIRLTSLKCVTCLYKKQPSPTIIPFLKKHLHNVLLSLKTNFKYHPQKRYLIKSLLMFIEQSPTIIQNHVQLLLQSILGYVEDTKNYQGLQVLFFKAFRVIIQNHPHKALIYIGQICKNVVLALGDRLGTKKRSQSLKLLNSLVKNCGYVIVPYFQVPELMNSLLYMLKSEISKESRNYILRIVGGFGAIDQQRYHTIKQILKEYQIEKKSEILINKNLNFNFLKWRKQVLENKRNDSYEKQVIKYSDQVMLIESKSRIFSRKSKQIGYQDIVHYFLGNKKSLKKDLISLNQNLQKSGIRENNQSYQNLQKISLNNFNLYIIYSLMNIVNDAFLKEKIQLTLDVLAQIFQILGKQLQKDLHVLIPLLMKCPQKQCVTLLIYLTRDCNVAEYVDTIIQYTFSNSISPDGLVNLLQIITYKYNKHIRNSVSTILNKLHSLIVSQPQNIKFQVKIVMIYRNLNDLLEPYLAQLIPIILQKFFTSKNTQATNASIDLFIALTLSCISMAQYLSQIVNKLSKILKLCGNNHSNCKPCLRTKIGNCFVLLLICYQQQFMVYLPIVHKSMIITSDRHQLYEKSLHYMENCYYGNLRDQFTDQQFDKIIPQRRVPVLNKYQIPKCIKKIEGTQQLIQQFDVTSKKFMQEDWIQWLRKISVLLIKKSPSAILRTCSDLAEGYTELALQLFNISFYSLWQILLDNQKKQILNHIKNILKISGENLHIIIRKAILNLCEFMNRKKVPLQISNLILSKCATESSAYAKTLYYKQIQFESAPEQSLQSLIQTYMKLGQPQNAFGLLTIADNIGIQCKVQWYQKLSKYQQAYNIYSDRLKNLGNKKSENYYTTIKKLQCLRYIDKEKFIDDLEQNQVLLSKTKQGQDRLAILACQCYSNLQEWEKVDEWTEKITTDKYPQQCNYYKSLLSIYANQLDNALQHINNTRKILYNQISQLIPLSTSTNSYEKIITTQKLCELQEIVQMLKLQQMLQNQQPNNIVLFNKSYLYYSHDLKGVKQSNSYKLTLQHQYNIKVNKLKQMWSDRLLGCPRHQEFWSRFVAVRSLFFNKLEYFQFFSQYCDILLQNKNLHLCQKMLHQFKIEYDEFVKMHEIQYQSQSQNQQKNTDDVKNRFYKDLQIKSQFIELLQIRISLAQGMKNQEHINQIIDFLHKKQQLSPKHKSKVYQECALQLLYPNNRNYDLNQSYQKQNITKTIQILKQSTSIYTSEKQLQLLGKIYLQTLDTCENPALNIKLALKSYMNLLKISQIDNQYFLQSCLKIFSVLLQYSNKYDQVYQQFVSTFQSVPSEVWINVVPQMIAHLHQNENLEVNQNFVKIIKKLFLKTGLKYPEAILYSLNFSIRSKTPHRVKPALQILQQLRQTHGVLCSQIQMISKQLSNAAIKLKQYWYDSIESIWGMYSQNKNSKQIIILLNNLKEQIFKKKSTNSEMAFHQEFGQQIKQGFNWLEQYQYSGNMLCLSQAFQIFIQVYMKIKESFENLKKVYLINVAPKLIQSRNYCSSIPGTYKLKGNQVRISSFENQLSVLQSKQRPRKLKIFGSDGKQYNFLLKGRQDIRLDERVMQFFGLINMLLQKERQNLKQDLTIQRYSIIPLTVNAGLIGWVQNCDTLNQLIKQYRTQNKIRLFVEREIYEKITPNYAYLPMMQKLEIFQTAQQLTQGKDLKNIFFYNSSSSQQWVERRNYYTTSLATMSMVGYILGLGDRHPSNIMINRNSGKIVHIDFGDCFEVAVLRDKFPEKVPFRLTRMLRNVMGPVGIHGVYKQTCENVMKVLRENKQSLLSVLQTFAHDPILSWKIIIDKKNRNENEVQKNQVIKNEQKIIKNDRKIENNLIGSIMQGLGQVIQERKTQKKQNQQENIQTPLHKKKYWQSIYPQKINQKAIHALVRIQKKLAGTDFQEEQMTLSEQIQRLIGEAVSHENICQSWPGWCPYW